MHFYHFSPQTVPLSPPEQAFPAATADALSSFFMSLKVEGISCAVAAMNRDTATFRVSIYSFLARSVNLSGSVESLKMRSAGFLRC